MRQRNRQRHQFRRLIASVSEHQSLIAGAAGVHAHRDVWRLRLNHIDHGAGLGIESKSRIVIANAIDYVAHQFRHIDIGFGCDFAGNDADASGYQSFASDPPGGIFRQYSIQDRVRDLVCNFIGMAFCNGLRGKNIFH